jgi:hypothetical protein
MAARTVDEYIDGLTDWRGAAVAAVREVIRGAAPEARESIKWAQPVYEADGPFAFIRAYSKNVQFGFWRGTELDDPDGRLAGEGIRMRHVNLTAADDLDRDALEAWVRQAVELNRTKGDPTRRS